MNNKVSSLQNKTIDFVDEGSHPHTQTGTESSSFWTILIVDDDRAVHDATRYALSNTVIEGRPVNFLHAYSAGEALKIVSSRSDIAVMLLDVVMENEHSGLGLVRSLRNDLNLHSMRIILRTGQPGHAPEAQVIRDYDINDYKIKSELTHTALVTTLTSAIRSYSQLCTILSSRRGLSLIVDSASDLLSRRSLKTFSRNILARLAELSDHPLNDTLICARFVPDRSLSSGRPVARVINANGRFTRWMDTDLDKIDDPDTARLVSQCFDEKHSVHGRGSSTLFLAGDQARDAVVHCLTETPLSAVEQQLIEVFCVNAAIGLKNISLFDDLHFLAYYDPLTNLLNRKGFINAIEACSAGREPGWTIALIDLEHFADINDALGHELGDALLIGVAQRLQSIFDAPCILGRVGPDVFGLLAPDVRIDPARMPDFFDEPITVDGYLLPVETTIGLTRMADAQGSGLDLFKTTSIALKHAKRDHRGRWLYHTHAMTVASRERHDLIYKLRNAISKHLGLAIHYQPQIEFSSGRVVGIEALLRWVNEDGQSVPPDQFITLAEYSGLMVNLGEWVFRTAVTQLMAWDAAGLAPMRLAINLSMAQFRDPRFVSRLRKIVEELKVPAHRLELEITESIAMLDAESVINSLSEFKSMGMEIAVDDFGTGFSSLTYLHRLPIDRLKIDRSFVQSMSPEGGSGNTISDMVIKLAHSLGLTVIAEGVESEDQACLLAEMGCEFGQGFLYSPAMPPEKLPEWLANRPA